VKKTILPVGPFHPAVRTPERAALRLDGERIAGLESGSGYTHRGLEKLAESRSWRQALALAERAGRGGAVAHALAFAGAVEALAGVRPPPRALYLRTIFAEVERVRDHLAWVSALGRALGCEALAMRAGGLLGPAGDVLEALTGSRAGFGAVSLGGAARDPGPEELGLLGPWLDGLEPAAGRLADEVGGGALLRPRLEDVGALDGRAARELGAVGPAARAAGLAIDVRRNAPYAAYADMEWDVCVEEGGDLLAIALVRARELAESARILRRAARRIPAGPVEAAVRAVPPGEAAGRAEAPGGEAFHFVISAGGPGPQRLRIRSPREANAAGLAARAAGAAVADAPLILAAAE